jgi:hypothetical protein
MALEGNCRHTGEGPCGLGSLLGRSADECPRKRVERAGYWHFLDGQYLYWGPFSLL